MDAKRKLNERPILNQNAPREYRGTTLLLITEQVVMLCAASREKEKNDGVQHRTEPPLTKHADVSLKIRETDVCKVGAEC